MILSIPWTLQTIPPAFNQFTAAQKEWALVRLNAMLRDNPKMDEGVLIATVVNMTKDHYGIARSKSMLSDFVFKADIADARLEDGHMFFSAIASTTDVDRQHERFTESALKAMESLGEVPITVGPTHEATIANVPAIIGWGSPHLSEDLQQFILEAELDSSHPNAQSLWNIIDHPERRKQIKLSVGGILPLGAVSRAFDAKTGESITEINDFELNHVLLCRSDTAVNQATGLVERAASDWQGMIFKAAADTLGRQPRGTGEGPGGVCVCPDCGYEQEHDTGEACNQIKCSECGATMTRKAEVTEEDSTEEKSDNIEDENTQVDKAEEAESMDIEAEKVSLASRILDFLRISKAEDEQATPEEVEGSAEKAEEVSEQPIIVQIPDEVTTLITQMGERLSALEKAAEPAEEVVEKPAEEVVEKPAEKAEEVVEAPVEEVVAEEVAEEVVVEEAEKSEEAALIAANFEAIYAEIGKGKEENEELKRINAALTEQLAAVASTKGISTQVPTSAGKAQTAQDENVTDYLANGKNWVAGEPPPYIGR